MLKRKPSLLADIDENRRSGKLRRQQCGRVAEGEEREQPRKQPGKPGPPQTAPVLMRAIHPILSKDLAGPESMGSI